MQKAEIASRPKYSPGFEGTDESALIRLWQEKRGEIEPEGGSDARIIKRA